MTQPRELHPDTELLDELEDFLARTRVPTAEDVAGSAAMEAGRRPAESD